METIRAFVGAETWALELVFLATLAACVWRYRAALFATTARACASTVTLGLALACLNAVLHTHEWPRIGVGALTLIVASQAWCVTSEWRRRRR